MSKITLKAARVNANISQKEAAQMLGVAPSTLRSWESGKTYPKQNQVNDILLLYGIKFDNIFFGAKSTLS